MVAGQTFDRAIEEQLESARAVVVLWSAHSVQSEWVRNEAGMASERERLVPVLIEDVKQPLEFRRRHAANLTNWTGDQNDPEFQVLCNGLAAKTERQPLRGVSRAPTGPVAVATADSGVTKRPLAVPDRGLAETAWRSAYGVGAGIGILSLALWFGWPLIGGGGADPGPDQAELQQRPTDRPSDASASTVNSGAIARG